MLTRVRLIYYNISKYTCMNNKLQGCSARQ
uniref:Uncharacterized protein n=1 Tax=Arundo donax TaxID=35708 RepID=A0A0A9BJY2_ARUDO